LREGLVVGLANYRALIARDGTETAMDGHFLNSRFRPGEVSFECSRSLKFK
jgi:hypothetical protein